MVTVMLPLMSLLIILLLMSRSHPLELKGHSTVSFRNQQLERSKTCLDGSNSSSTVNDLSLLSTTRPFNTTSLFPQFQNLPSESILDFCTMRLLRLFQSLKT
ncbi:hypothetical protein P9112_009268 [Eukaryota sp. TZLM1-RC]